MTQEWQFSPPVKDDSSSAVQTDDSDSNTQQWVFGGSVNVKPEIPVSENKNIPPVSEWVQLDDTVMPDFGVPHDAPKVDSQSTGVFGGDMNDDTEGKLEDIKIEPVPEFNPVWQKEEEIEVSEKIWESVISKDDNLVQEKLELWEQENKEEQDLKSESKIEVEELEKDDNSDNVSVLKNKFDSLFRAVKNVYSLKNITDESLFDIVASDNDTVRVVYSFGLEEDSIEVIVVKRKELDVKTDEEKEDLLEFEFDMELWGIQLLLNDDLLFDEKKDLEWNVKQKMQVIEKMDKFIFLIEWYVKKIEKELEEKKKAESEKKAMLDIFKKF